MNCQAQSSDGRMKAIVRYKILAVVYGTAGIGLLICGIVAAGKYNSEQSFGPPYFIGGFVVGFMAILEALFCTCTIMKAADCETNELKRKELACGVMGQYFVTMLVFMACFVGIVCAGIGGFSSGLNVFHKPIESLNKSLAIIILIGCILVLFINIYAISVICIYGSYFGITIGRPQHGQVIVWNQQAVAAATIYPSEQSHLWNPDMQNQYLQQQSMLNQQQQHNQYYGGVNQQQMPPAYPETGITYQQTQLAFPSAPPPTYDKAMPN